MPLTHDQYWVRRRYWWLRPAILAPALLLIALAIPMGLWIASYGDAVAVIAFAVTYLSLLVFVLLMIRRSMLDVREKVNTRMVDAARSSIVDQRRQMRSGLAVEDVTAARIGRSGQVLDIWRLDPSLRERHQFFRGIQASTILPGTRDLGIRIHLTNPGTRQAMEEDPSSLLMDLRDFLVIVSGDPHLRMLRQHLDALVIVLYALEDDRSFEGHPVPVLSLHVRMPELDRFAASEDPSTPFPGSFRFEGGDRIEPHGEIHLPTAAGTK